MAFVAAQDERDAYIITDERNDQGDGNFNYAYETSNNIYQQKTGTPGSEGQSNMNGAFRWDYFAIMETLVCAEARSSGKWLQRGQVVREMVTQ